MGDVKIPQRVQFFCGVIFAPDAPIVEIRRELEVEFGPIDFESPVFGFNFTDYYREEMGGELRKIFYAFEKLVLPDAIVEAKLKTNAMERRYASPEDAGEGRIANLDPGYVTLAKMILATTKDFAHRIYLRDGIFAEITLTYKKNGFTDYPWTYPDYKTIEYISFFNELRARYKKKIESV
jgi:hypothetical protein